eukprot:5182053-Karenia_brevis.AAC.1
MASRRQRSLFPLPSLDPDESCPLVSQHFKGSDSFDRQAAISWANEGIEALNVLAGHGVRPNKDVKHSGATWDTVKRIKEAYFDLDFAAEGVVSGKEA